MFLPCNNSILLKYNQLIAQMYNSKIKPRHLVKIVPTTPTCFSRFRFVVVCASDNHETEPTQSVQDAHQQSNTDMLLQYHI